MGPAGDEAGERGFAADRGHRCGQAKQVMGKQITDSASDQGPQVTERRRWGSLGDGAQVTGRR
jgi:hypothetical protein